MPKRLYLIRHAKSDWTNMDLKDFDRPLNQRGHLAAPEMGKRLADKNLKPQLIISSPALRAISTAKYFAEAWKIDPTAIILQPDIYEASIRTLLSIVNGLDDQFNSIALFGHNPGFTDLANYLTHDYVANMPTASVVMIDFNIDSWAMLSNGTGETVMFDYPKNNVGD